MTLLDEEIAEQPAALARLLDRLPADVERVRALAAGCTAVTVVARGSSDNAARYGQYVTSLRSDRPVALATPSLTTVYGRTPRWRSQLLIAVSQSGRSSDIRAVVAAARDQGVPTVVVTNDAGSPLAAAADHVVDLVAGPERSVAATKTYTTSLLAMAGIAVALGPPADDDAAWADLRRLPELAAATLQLADEPAAAVAERLQHASKVVTVGRGLNLSTAFETSLKLGELTGIQVVPFSPADLQHGPIGAVDADVPALVVAPEEPATASSLDVVPMLLERGSEVVVLAHPRGGAALPDGIAATVPVADGVPWWLSPVIAALPGQLLARATARRRGLDLDRPPGLQKVTDTR